MSTARVNTQLSDYSSYDPSKMLFKINVGNLPGSKLTYHRVNISTMNEDGTQGDLIFKTPGELFCFGISENHDQATHALTGYTLPLCLYSKDGPTEEEKAWVDTFDKIVERCKGYLLENKKLLKKFDLEASDLKKLNPLYWKKDKETGEIIKEYGPTLYAKIITSKSKDKDDNSLRIISMFRDENGDDIDPMTLIGSKEVKRFCYARAAIKIESIFVGAKITLQVKLYETEIRRVESGMKSLIGCSRPKLVPQPSLSLSATTSEIMNSTTASSSSDTIKNDDDSSSESESEEEKPLPSLMSKSPEKAPLPVKKAPVRKVVKK